MRNEADHNFTLRRTGQRDETHRQLIAYVLSAPEEQFTRDTRFRRRLRLDTYNHYPKHAKAIREWRQSGLIGIP